MNTEGMYVALTRGRNDQRTYTIAPDDQQTEPPELPIITDDRTALEALAESLSKPRGHDLATAADPHAAATLDQLNQRDRQPGDRAVGLAETRIASTAINSPDPITVAALGPRPAVGEHRRTPANTGEHRRIWDTAVGEAATYRARWETDEVTIDGSVTPAKAGDGAQRHDHFDRAHAAILAADIEHLARMPLEQLLGERHAAKSSLPRSPTQDVRKAEMAVTNAGNNVEDARRGLGQAQSAYEAVQPGRPRQRDPSTIESARGNVEQSTRALAEAEQRLITTKQHLKASRGNTIDQTAAQARIAAIDRALDRRIDMAVQRPASYLTEILGKRLRGDTEGRGWDKAARSIETYRHHHLGISPEHGSRPGDGIHKAIGEPPTNHTLRLRFWKQTQRHVDEHLSPSPERDNALQRTR